MTRILRWTVAALGLIGNYGCGEATDEEVTAAAERDAYERKITFSLPIEYSATVTQCDMHRECRTRFYSPRQK